MSTFQAYLIAPPSGPREWGTVKVECERRARELGGTCEPIDVPATKTALIPFLNELEQRHAAPLALVVSSDAIGDDELEALREQPAGSIVPMLDPDKFDARVLERQVEALGELGEKGLDQVESYQELHGVGAAFSRGVHLLTIVAAGEHQLARIFLRKRKAA